MECETNLKERKEVLPEEGDVHRPRWQHDSSLLLHGTASLYR